MLLGARHDPDDRPGRRRGRRPDNVTGYLRCRIFARMRRVSPVRTDGFTVYVANLRAYHKTQEIAANPKVELCYLDDQHDQVRITGVAEIVTERPLLQEIWDANPLLRQYLGSLDNPMLIVYRIQPVRVRYMKEWALEYMNVPLEAAESSAESHARR